MYIAKCSSAMLS